MNSERSEPDNPEQSTGRASRLLLFHPVSIGLVGSLFLLTGSGWLQSGRLKLTISGLSRYC